MIRMAKGIIFVGFSSVEGFHVFSTKAGLARRVGCGVGKLGRALGEGKAGVIDFGGVVWWVSEVEVVRQEARGVAVARGPVTSKNDKGWT